MLSYGQVEGYARVLERVTALLEGLEALAVAAAQAGDEAAHRQALAAIHELRLLIESIGQDLAAVRSNLWAHRALAGRRFRRGGVTIRLRKPRWLYLLTAIITTLLLYRPAPRPTPKPAFEPLKPSTQDLTQALVIAPAAPPLGA